MFTPANPPNPLNSFETKLRQNQALNQIGATLGNYSFTLLLVIFLLILVMISSWAISAITSGIEVPNYAVVNIKSPLPGTPLVGVIPIEVDILTVEDAKLLQAKLRVGDKVNQDLEVIKTGDNVVTLRGQWNAADSPNIYTAEIFLYQTAGAYPVLHSYTRIPLSAAPEK